MLNRISYKNLIKRSYTFSKRYVWILYTCILLFVLDVLQAELDQSVTKFSFPRSKFGQYTLQRRLDTIYHLGLPDCARECLYVTRCKSFQHYTPKGKCTLNQIDSTFVDDDSWDTDNDYIFADRTDLPKAIAGSCASEPCSTDEKCIPSNPPTCVLYCGAPPGSGNATFEEACITVGCVLIYTCDEGFTSTGQDMSITCQSNSTWSPYKFSCIVHCGPPPIVSNAIVGPGLETENANRTYTCVEPYEPSSATTSIFCQNPANWTTPEFECTLYSDISLQRHLTGDKDCVRCSEGVVIGRDIFKQLKSRSDAALRCV